jgi:hypothetical protein
MPASLLRVVGPIASALVLLGCEIVPHGAATADQARRDFSSSAFCPMGRVAAERVEPIPPPPPAIARDGERMEMWRETFEARAQQSLKQTIAVSGCGESTTYICHDWVGYRTGRRGRRYRVFLGAACLEMGDAAQPVSTRSTMPEPAPKTTASSR